MLEHFEDDLNLNISNSHLMDNFLRVAKTVRKNLNDKYHDGEFADPGNVDPKVAAATPATWATVKMWINQKWYRNNLSSNNNMNKMKIDSIIRVNDISITRLI